MLDDLGCIFWIICLAERHSVNPKLDRPEAVKQPHCTTLPPPCLTMRTVFLSWRPLPSFTKENQHPGSNTAQIYCPQTKGHTSQKLICMFWVFPDQLQSGFDELSNGVPGCLRQRPLRCLQWNIRSRRSNSLQISGEVSHFPLQGFFNHVQPYFF